MLHHRRCRVRGVNKTVFFFLILWEENESMRMKKKCQRLLFTTACIPESLCAMELSGKTIKLCSFLIVSLLFHRVCQHKCNRLLLNGEMVLRMYGGVCVKDFCNTVSKKLPGLCHIQPFCWVVYYIISNKHRQTPPKNPPFTSSNFTFHLVTLAKTSRREWESEDGSRETRLTVTWKIEKHYFMCEYFSDSVSSIMVVV